MIIFLLSNIKIKFLILYIAIILLTIYPVMRFQLTKNLPIYIIDILTFLSLIFIINKDDIRISLEKKIYIKLFWFLWLPSSFFSLIHGIFLTGVFAENIYMFFRTILSLGLFLLLTITIRNSRELDLIVYLLIFGMTVSGLLSVFNAFLPPDHPISIIIDNASPLDLNQATEDYMRSGQNVRARALFGSPNGLGSFLATSLSFAIAILLRETSTARKLLLSLVTVIGIVGTLVTYSRTAYLTLFIVLGTYLFYSLHIPKITFRVFQGGILAILVFLSLQTTFRIDITPGTTLDRIGEALEDSNANTRNLKRIEAYQNMIPFLIDNPKWYFVGRGFAAEDIRSRGIIDWTTSSAEILITQNHSLIAFVFYQRGLISTLVFIFLWMSILLSIISVQRNMLLSQGATNKTRLLLNIASLAAILSMLPAILFDHFYASSIYMQYILFFFFGIAVTECKIDSTAIGKF